VTFLHVPYSLEKRRCGEDVEADFASVEEEAFTLVSPRHFQNEENNLKGYEGNNLKGTI